MATRATDEIFTNQIKQQIRDLTRAQHENLTKLSTGQRINGPSDDPQATGRVLSFKSDRRELVQYQKNAEHAIAIADVSGESINGIYRNIVRAQEIASKTNNELNTDSFGDFASEVNQIIESVLSLGNSEYLGSPLFAGTRTNASPFNPTRDVNGNITSVTYDGNSAGNEFYITETTRISPYGDGTINNNILTTITNLISLRDALNAANPTAVAGLMPSLINDEQNNVQALATFGSLTVRVESSMELNEVAIRQADTRISREVSADFAETLVDLNRIQTAFDGTMTATARALKQTLLNFV